MKDLNRKGALIIGIPVVILLLVVGVGVYGFKQGWFEGLGGGAETAAAAGQTGAAGAGNPEATVGLSTTSPQLDFIGRDIENKGTAVAIGVSYKRNGLINYDADGLDIDVSPGESIEFLVNSTSGYYSVHSKDTSQLSATKGTFSGGKYVVPYDENPQVSVLMKRHGTSATIQMYCEDDGLLNSNDATEAVTATQTPKIITKLLGHAERYVQDPLLVSQYDKTYWDTDMFKAGNYPTLATPSCFVANDTAADGDRTWNVGGDLVGNEIREFTFTWDSDDTNNAGDTIYEMVYLEDQDYYIDEDEGTLDNYGPCDENDADVGINTRIINHTFRVATS